ncbi:MAG TPA: translation initiation factor IF-1 [Candidatus Paceibacterota bacterium]|jgi:translation initiation factor IF-1|nr:translation initiation factor IF-1 [Candidatus Paceibacterota bacterium]HRV32650.1 translation initiation factor IF-1 [Candidatus Paceibacterota bacterium]
MNSEQKNKNLIIDGVVTESLPSTTFRVKLDDGREILAYLAGKLRMNFIKILVGDRVKIEMSAYDDSRGRIIYRY